VIHNDRVKGTIFGTKATVHADIRVNVELSWFWNRATGVRVIGTNDPNTLRRADFGTDSARSAALFHLPIW
jgi:hypothetical protein